MVQIIKHGQPPKEIECWACFSVLSYLEKDIEVYDVNDVRPTEFRIVCPVCGNWMAVGKWEDSDG